MKEPSFHPLGAIPGPHCRDRHYDWYHGPRENGGITINAQEGTIRHTALGLGDCDVNITTLDLHLIFLHVLSSAIHATSCMP